jgi:hypothetical protein
MQYFINFLYLWVILFWISFFLILFRSDSLRVYEDLDLYFKKRKFIFWLFNAFILFCIMPFSIPYSIANIFHNKKK